MIDPVAVDLDGKHGTVCERAYAEAMDLRILDDEPIYSHGRLRGVFRIDGRDLKPKVRLPRGKAKSDPDDSNTGDSPVAGSTDGVAVENTEE